MKPIRCRIHACLPSLLLALTLGLGGCDAGPETGQESSRQKPGSPTLSGVSGELQAILLEPDVLVRAESLARILQSVEPIHLEEVLNAYDTVFLDVGDFELELLAHWWAGFDPEEAYAWTKQDWRASHPLVGQAVLRAWARTDPREALRAAEAEGLFSVRRPAIAAVLAGWEEGGRPGAFEYVESLPPGHDRQRLQAFVAGRKVLRDGVEASFEWAESQPDEPFEFKQNLFRRVASATAEVEPRKAAAWVEKHLDGPFADQLPQRVGTRWVKRDPDAAMMWFSTLPRDRNTQAGLRETYRFWLRVDKPAARAWMDGHEKEPWMDAAVALYAMSSYSEDRDAPLVALEQALAIDEEEARWATVGRIWRVWYFRDDKAAEEWFLAHQDGIPEFYRQRIPTIPGGMLKASKSKRPSFVQQGDAQEEPVAPAEDGVEDAS